ncbi:MAG: hypothetical protein ACK5BG_04335 [Pseudanabaena sp.]
MILQIYRSLLNIGLISILSFTFVFGLAIRTYAKERAVGAINELPLRQNEAFRAFLRKSYWY